MAEWQEKVWGRTRTTHRSPLYSRHELEVEEGGYSSVHWHAQRANRFLVVSGAIRVVELYGWQERVFELTAGNTHDVPSLVPHQFQVIESGRVIEEYWPDRGGEVLEEDIIRLTRGGMNQDLVVEAEGVLR